MCKAAHDESENDTIEIVCRTVIRITIRAKIKLGQANVQSIDNSSHNPDGNQGHFSNFWRSFYLKKKL